MNENCFLLSKYLDKYAGFADFFLITSSPYHLSEFLLRSWPIECNESSHKHHILYVCLVDLFHPVLHILKFANISYITPCLNNKISITATDMMISGVKFLREIEKQNSFTTVTPFFDIATLSRWMWRICDMILSETKWISHSFQCS